MAASWCFFILNMIRPQDICTISVANVLLKREESLLIRDLVISTIGIKEKNVNRPYRDQVKKERGSLLGRVFCRVFSSFSCILVLFVGDLEMSFFVECGFF